MGIFALHATGRRYVNVFLDPAQACNLRCQMCYFSDPEARKQMRGVFSEEDIKAFAKAIFPRAIKLQIGCGAEPTVYHGLVNIVKLAKEYGVPYVAITTNGNLLNKDKLRELAYNGLDEITVSTHGFTKNTYETLMQGGSYEAFLQLRDALQAVREEYPSFHIRINYTINEDNVEELITFKDIFKDVLPNVLQIRPIQKIGNSKYCNFSLDKIRKEYDTLLQPVVDFCKEKNITCIYPTIDNLWKLEAEVQEESHGNSTIDSLTYFYISPYEGWKEKIMDPYHETFKDYCKRTKRTTYIIRSLLGLTGSGSPEEKSSERTKNLNYNVK